MNRQDLFLQRHFGDCGHLRDHSVCFMDNMRTCVNFILPENHSLSQYSDVINLEHNGCIVLRLTRFEFGKLHSSLRHGNDMVLDISISMYGGLCYRKCEKDTKNGDLVFITEHMTDAQPEFDDQFRFTDYVMPFSVRRAIANNIPIINNCWQTLEYWAAIRHREKVIFSTSSPDDDDEWEVPDWMIQAAELFP